MVVYENLSDAVYYAVDMETDTGNVVTLKRLSKDKYTCYIDDDSQDTRNLSVLLECDSEGNTLADSLDYGSLDVDMPDEIAIHSLYYPRFENSTALERFASGEVDACRICVANIYLYSTDGDDENIEYDESECMLFVYYDKDDEK